MTQPALETKSYKAPRHDPDDSDGQLSPAARKQVYSAVGKQVASSLGARLLTQMLADSGLSLRGLAEVSGFDVSVLSKIANGKRDSGPELWTLFALAEAMELDLKLSFDRR